MDILVEMCLKMEMLGKLLGFYLIRQGCLNILHRSMDATTNDEKGV